MEKKDSWMTAGQIKPALHILLYSGLSLIIRFLCLVLKHLEKKESLVFLFLRTCYSSIVSRSLV